MRLSLSVFLCFLSCLRLTASPSQSAETKTFSDTVMASILVASPGEKIYQTTGHSAIRLQCPAYGLDNVFSYETDTDGGIAKHFLGKAKGRFGALVFSEYQQEFAKEGRGLTEYPLNLSDPEIRKLWQMLDMAIADRTEGDFNIRFANCNSYAMMMVDNALGREHIEMRETEVSAMDNATAQKRMIRNRPWAVLLLNTAMGADCDSTDSWHTRMVPLVMDKYFKDAMIVSPDGLTRPLIASAPRVILEPKADVSEKIISPLALALILLGVAVILSALDFSGRCMRAVHIADIILLVFQTLASLALIAVSLTPASIGSAWNWMYIPFNILPALAWLIWRNRKVCRYVFIAYSLACLLFTAAPLLTSQAAPWSSVIALAIFTRVFSHYYLKTLKRK